MQKLVALLNGVGVVAQVVEDVLVVGLEQLFLESVVLNLDTGGEQPREEDHAVVAD